MKEQRKLIDGRPSKRLFWAIMSDYDLQTSIAELIDNVHDAWARHGRTTRAIVTIEIDTDRQIIKVSDNVGGVPEDKHQLLIAPGAGANDPNDRLIGLFGVGSKRACVALAEDIRIRTRTADGKPYEIDIDRHWLEDDDSWDLPVYEIAEQTPGTTEVDLSRLRIHPTPTDLERLRPFIGETYARFLEKGDFIILLNGVPVEPISFDHWSFPPGFEPKECLFELYAKTQDALGVELTGGLINDEQHRTGGYGVYIYCNDRLIAKELKDREVGYISGAAFAGLPHSDASLARVIVSFHGPAKLMPWNSSKSAVNYGHTTFRGIQPKVIDLVAHFTSLSRRFARQ